MNLREPKIPCNGTSNLKPELIGLAAWLCCNDVGSYSRDKILKHAGAHGSLEGLPKDCFDTPEDRELACQAFAEGKLLAVRDEPNVLGPNLTARLERSEHRNGNGHQVDQLPPIRGGSPVRLDPAGVNGMEHPDDIEF